MARIAVGDEEFDDFGATAVDAEDVEQDILARAAQAAAEPHTSESEEVDEGEQQAAGARAELQAVEHELAAVEEILQRLNEEGGAAPAQGDEDAWSDDEAEAQASHQTSSEVASAAGGGAYVAAAGPDAGASEGSAGAADGAGAASDLQRVVMSKRLAGLQSRQRELEAAVQNAEAAASSAARDSSAVPAAGQQRPAGDAAVVAAAAASAAKQQAAQLVDDDVFAAAPVRPRGRSGSAGGGLIETERDRLIRTGVITPFDRLDGFERTIERAARPSGTRPGPSGPPVNPGFENVARRTREEHERRHLSKLVDPADLPRREQGTRQMDESFWRASASGHKAATKKRRKQTLPRGATRKRLRKAGAAARRERLADSDSDSAAGSDIEPEDEEVADEEDCADLTGEFDDADAEAYENRVQAYKDSHSALAMSDESEDVVFEGGFRVPADIYNRLFDYQKTGVKWLWELHTQRAGGIIGDEMGLGKTVQLAAFLAGLHRGGRFRPSLIVCPATVLRQWLRELRAWYPPFRVVILHDSARSAFGARPSRQDLIRELVNSEAGILITTYEHLRRQHADLLNVRWGYAVLDEGHRIRNPDAEVTLMAKQLQTVHRIIMTGTPVQNRLPELWSLFDFVFPGKLGTLPVFQTQFAVPIQIGGYANASSMQVSTAYKCAVVLRDLISPYLLRRRKVDVEAELPEKTEQVLFCRLSSEQRELYRAYLASKDVEAILAGDRNALAGIDVLRKICNHPDLLQRTTWENSDSYGAVERSGKLQVVIKVLRAWHSQGHRALVFTQTQQMLDIVEKTVAAEGYAYHRMDGSTAVASRMRLMDDFNESPRTFAFLLTTKVGGIGVNLTGANRVLIVDPDWNPATDMQARERAWRIGQRRPVTVYRLITSGTIEEKVYHRQIYKQFLTNKVLQDPRQRRFFKAKDMSDLFTLGSEYASTTETSTIFAGLNGEVVPDAPDGGAAELKGDGVLAVAARDGDVAAGSGEAAAEAADATDAWGSPVAAAAARDGGAAEPAGGSGSRNRQGRKARAAAFRAVKGVPPDGDAELRGPEPAAAEAGAAGGDGHDDAHILRELFDGTGIMGALDHNKIEGANEPGARAVEVEASRIARRAAEALRQSRAAVQRSAINEPTWTGHSGAAGAPTAATPRPRFGAAANPALRRQLASAGATAAIGGISGTDAGGGSSPGTGGVRQLRFGATGGAGASGGKALRSADLLAQLRARNASAAAAGLAEAHGDADDAAQMREAQSLTQRICQFLESAGGSAPTPDIIAHFGDTVPQSRMALFRQLLKQVSTLKRVDGAKAWVLKNEYQAPP